MHLTTGASVSGLDVADIAQLEPHRRMVATRFGDVSFLDVGSGPVALFVHGAGTNAFLWRKVIQALSGDRRLIAVDLPLHGRSPAGAEQPFGLAAFAHLLGEFCDELGLTAVDLVANDTGGAVAQILAANGPGRIRTLTLTNCETHDNVPPRAFRSTIWLARAGVFALTGPRLLRNTAGAARRVLGAGYEDVDAVPHEVVRSFLEPILATRERARLFQRWLVSLRAADLLEIEPGLRRLDVPALMVWGTGDRFFDVKWAYWLAETLPGPTEVVELPGARLFFPDERANELVTHLRRHWGLGPADRSG